MAMTFKITAKLLNAVTRIAPVPMMPSTYSKNVFRGLGGRIIRGSVDLYLAWPRRNDKYQHDIDEHAEFHSPAKAERKQSS